MTITISIHNLNNVVPRMRYDRFHSRYKNCTSLFLVHRLYIVLFIDIVTNMQTFSTQNGHLYTTFLTVYCGHVSFGKELAYLQ
jgi:hypothetical protein